LGKVGREFSLVTLVSSVGSGGFGGDIRWIVDSGASCHMTRIWRVFLIITETGPDRMVVNEGGMARVVRGVGKVRFQLKYGGFLELDGVLFVPGLRVNLLSVSALEDVGYCTLFKREHVFIYREGVDPVELQLIGDRVDRLYMLRGQPSVYDSALMRSMRRLLRLWWYQGFSLAFREKRASLFLALAEGSAECGRTNAQNGVDSPRSSGFG
jgi:hypothetical protein